MQKLLSLFIVFVLVSFTQQPAKQKVVFFGDSITQAGVEKTGYITVLSELLQKNGLNDRFDLVGAGIGGNKVYDLYLRLEEDVLSKKPDVVVIWIGVNDVWHKRLAGTGTDPDKFERFYQAIITKLKAANIRVLLTTPAAVGERTDHSNELDGDLNRYSTIIRNLATKNNCPLIDLRKDFLAYNLEHNKENKESGVLTSDRVHLNETGNRFVAEKMLTALRALPQGK